MMVGHSMSRQPAHTSIEALARAEKPRSCTNTSTHNCIHSAYKQLHIHGINQTAFFISHFTQLCISSRSSSPTTKHASQFHPSAQLKVLHPPPQPRRAMSPPRLALLNLIPQSHLPRPMINVPISPDNKPKAIFSRARESGSAQYVVAWWQITSQDGYNPELPRYGHRVIAYTHN